MKTPRDPHEVAQAYLNEWMGSGCRVVDEVRGNHDDFLFLWQDKEGQKAALLVVDGEVTNDSLEEEDFNRNKQGSGFFT